MRASFPILTLMAATLVAACASEPPRSGMSSTEGTTVVQTAEVTDVRDIKVHEGRATGIGSIIGAIVGGVAGNTIGGGDGQAIATAAGAVGGSLAGQDLEQKSSSRSSVELTLRFPNGDVHTYQVGTSETFQVGDQVKVTTNRGVTRITH
ncbi:MAG TPA: glycine zipper 2TM domain-containing protein [Noviherbaspirillum sp.]|uniref:glycine zipper 2TM domain-containing protein n=1 Tax=Noviherbaspirillum sp. TaxID=1926288 RepID=UPI002B4862F1|nr:glycine zipper 2TM domain-containing protein [Noviherbaspirillum sp.]HJV88099.1 glycine zipper 2TM domain-containing protein [Noviherbaspirillum sp.]